MRCIVRAGMWGFGFAAGVHAYLSTGSIIETIMVMAGL